MAGGAIGGGIGFVAGQAATGPIPDPGVGAATGLAVGALGGVATGGPLGAASGVAVGAAGGLLIGRSLEKVGPPPKLEAAIENRHAPTN